MRLLLYCYDLIFYEKSNVIHLCLVWVNQKKTWSVFFFAPYSSKNAMKVSFSLHTETSGISLVWFLYDLKQACIAFFEALQSSGKKYSDPAEAATRCVLRKILHVFKENHLCRSLFFLKFIKKR